MTTHAIPSRARPPGRGFSELVKVETKLALRVPVGVVLGIVVPVIFLVIFSAMPALRKPAAGTTLTLFAQYVPDLRAPAKDPDPRPSPGPDRTARLSR
jgi:hypothetical protein